MKQKKRIFWRIFNRALKFGQENISEGPEVQGLNLKSKTLGELEFRDSKDAPVSNRSYLRSIKFPLPLSSHFDQLSTFIAIKRDINNFFNPENNFFIVKNLFWTPTRLLGWTFDDMFHDLFGITTSCHNLVSHNCESSIHFFFNRFDLIFWKEETISTLYRFKIQL